MKMGNDGTEYIEKQSAHSIPPSSDSPPPQTLHAKSEPTESVQLRKLPTQLNTPNRNVPDLVRVSPNASDVQRLGRCVPALSDSFCISAATSVFAVSRLS